MKKVYLPLLLMLAVLSFSACKKVSSQEELQKIRTLEEQLKANRKQSTGQAIRPDMDLLKKLGESYVAFADEYPEAPETPEFLFRAGELYSNELKDMPKALSLFEKIYSQYPDHETAPNALFFTGYLYHNNLGDLVRAEKTYKEFIQKYPTHKMREHAEFELETLGMPIGDVMKKIMGGDSTTTTQDSLPQQGQNAPGAAH
jgi:tetratricopeptide (TPR) repeat protein